MLLNKLLHFNILSVLKLSWKQYLSYAFPKDFHRLSFSIEGCAEFSHGGKTFYTDENNLIFIPKGFDYTINAKTNRTVLVVNFETLEDANLEIETLKIKNRELFIQLLENMYDIFNKKEYAYHYQLQSLFYNLLAHLKISSSETEENMEFNFKSLLHYIHANFQNPELSVKELAKQLCFSETTLRTLFLKHFNISPKQYIINLRLKHAQALLKADYFTIAEIAYNSGFNDPKYFSTCYKKHFGYPPKSQKGSASSTPTNHKK